MEWYKTQIDFIRCEDRFTGFIAGIGSGKTIAGAGKALYNLSRLPGRGLVVAPTYPMLRDATLQTFLELTAPLEPHLAKGEMAVTVAGKEVLFRSADNPDRLRGPNLSWAWIDEAGLCPRRTWEIVIGRVRAYGLAGPCWLTGTPKGRNWLYELIGNLTLFRAATKDNPYLAPEFIESLEAAYHGKFARQELYGEFVGYEGLVYEEFDRLRHVAGREEDWRRVVVGVDEGYTNPAVLLPIGFDGDGRAHILGEYYKRRALQGEVVMEAASMYAEYPGAVFVVDPSAAGLIAEMRAAGLPVRGGDNAVFAGIQGVKARLAAAGDGRPRLTIDPAAANTLAEFEAYCWKESRQGVKDEPEKIMDHAMDALRYALRHVDGGSQWRIY